MSKIDLSDKVSIINYGIGTQHKIAGLSETVSNLVKNKDYSDIKKLYDTLLKLLSAGKEKAPEYSTLLIEGIRESLVAKRVELLKESVLYAGLRETDQAYIKTLSAEIAAGEKFIEKVKSNSKTVYDTMSLEQLRNRIDELKTTKTVAGTLSDQLSLYEKNSAALADRIGSVTNTLMPLWESGNALALNKSRTQKAFRALKALVDESVKAMG